MSKVYSVTVVVGDTHKSYSPEFQSEERFAKGWKSVLMQAHGKADVVCECEGKDGRKLAVRHYEENDSFALARFPLTGAQHARDCQFYSATAVTVSAGGESVGVVDTIDGGMVKVRLGIGLKKVDDADNEPTEPSTPRPSAGGRRQTPIKLLGLLQYLWSEAGLNRWWPAMEGKRDAGKVHWLIQTAAEQVKVGRIQLSDTLLLSAKSANSAVAVSNRSKVTTAGAESLRLLVVAPLAKYSPEQDDVAGHSLRIAGFHGTPFMRMSKELWTISEKRFPRAISAWKASARVMVIAQIELDAKSPTRSQVVDLGLMHVTASWIPVDSSYEEVIANKLVAEGRAFDKPLRFDPESEQELPDFVLIDTDEEVPLEVFGRTDEKYLKRKALKTDRYAEQGAWWSWNAATDPLGQNIPAFPQKRNR